MILVLRDFIPLNRGFIYPRPLWGRVNISIIWVTLGHVCWFWRPVLVRHLWLLFKYGVFVAILEWVINGGS